jgi:alkylation response protein AidB-like acyl-CoA dehydrogenase
MDIWRACFTSMTPRHPMDFASSPGTIHCPEFEVRGTGGAPWNGVAKVGLGTVAGVCTVKPGRIGIASQALGIAAGAYELALKYSKERKAFGKELSQHQAIQFKLADMATKIDAARLLIWQAAYLKDQKKDFVKAAAQAKLFASQIAQEVTTEAVQIHGGYGYVKEFHVERLMRDAKITQIYEGTTEIQKLVISRELLRQ